MPQPSTIKPIPDGFRTVTPHLVVEGAVEALNFYTKAFAATVMDKTLLPDGRVKHGAMKIGATILFVVDDFPEWSGGKAKHPHALGGSSVSIHLYCDDCDDCDDCDGWTRRAGDAGCTVVMEPMNAFWGDRFAMVRDPYGHEWTIATHNREMTKEQMTAEMKQAGMC